MNHARRSLSATPREESEDAMQRTTEYGLSSVAIATCWRRKIDGRWYPAAMSPLAAEARRVHDQAQLSDRQIAAATGARPSTVRDWLSGRSAPSGARADRLVELGAMVDRLARVMQADFIPIWLTRPIEALDDEKPVEVLARGDYRRIAKLIGELEYPGVS